MLKLSFSIVILSILLTPSVARQRIAASETPPAADTVARTEPPASDGTAALPRPAADTVSAMTLDACMAYAVEHNPNVRQQVYANRNYRQEYIASIAALVPSISASASATTSFGRSVDPETNTYTTVANLDNSYSLSGQIPVFAGLSGINTVRAARVMRLMGIEELQQARDEAALNAMQAYFDVVYYTESVRLAREQRQTSAANLRKSRKLYELGLKSAADVAEIESQCASDDFLLTQQENNLALAKISLCEAMNYPSGSCPEIVAEIAVGTPAGAAAYGEVLAYALEKHPKAQQAAYNVQQMRLKYSVAKGKYYPSVSVGGGYSTNFFMSLDDRSLYAPFGSQLRDNRGYYFSARLSIPIFGGLTKRTSVNRARNNCGSPNCSATRRCARCKARWRKPTSRCWVRARSSYKPPRKRKPHGWPTKPSPASTNGAWSRRSTCKRPPTSCCKPAPNGFAPACNTSSKPDWWSTTTASR